MKTTKIQYFLYKRENSDNVAIYAPSNADSHHIPYYSKRHDSTDFYEFMMRSLVDLENALKKNNYNFICSLLIPSDHTKEDLTVYYTTIKKKLSL